MINVSENLKSLISEDSRTFRVRLVNDLNTYENIRSFRKSIMFPSSSLSIGNALSACIECSATDIPVSITGERIKAEITIPGCEEQILLGTFKAEKPTVKDGDVSFVAYDAMKTATEKTYKSTLDEGEHTAQEYFTDICTVLGESCEALDEADGALVIAEDKLSGYSCRDALAYLAGYLGKNCIVNPKGLFEMIGFAAVDYDLFNEDRIAEPEFADNFCCLGYINCCIDNETTLQTGTGSNGFELISPIMTQERLDAVGQTVFGEASVIKEYKPCKVVQLLGDPRIEVCDVLDLSYGGEVYKVPVMAVTLEYDGGLMATAESYAPSEPQSTSLGERMTFAQKQAQKENDAHISGIVEFSQLIQAAYGVKSTTVDGITYFHDKEALAESTFIFCITSEGFAQASGENCWGGSHKDTVWKYGLSKDGTAVLDMLNVFKITASLIRAGRLESNDGNAYFDLDNEEIGVSEKDENGENIFEATLTSQGLKMNAKNIYSIDDITVTEDEKEAIKKSLLAQGLTEDSLVFKALYGCLIILLKATKIKYGVTITGTDSDGNYFLSQHSANEFYIYKKDTDGNLKKTNYADGGISSDKKFIFTAPEMYFKGDILPRILASGTDFNEVTEKGVYVGDELLGDGENSNYSNSPSAVNASFLFEVIPIGSNGQIMQRITICSKGNSRKWERHYHSSSWGNWYCTYADRNTVLWSGAESMNAETDSNGNVTSRDVITLSEPIYTQPNGIVLVFSYLQTDGTAGNYQFQSFFKSKYEISAHPGGGHQFMLCNNCFELMATKYLYINDNQISGHQDNMKNGKGNSGIVYNNERYVLRYVIGV